MELDIDSLLNSAFDSEVDSPSSSIPHRTLDEILNSSDSSPSPPSSPRSTNLSQKILHLDVPSVSDGAESHDYSVESLKLRRAMSSFVSGELPRVQSSLSSSRQLSLFTGMKMSAKPGAALAAAAAASRSIPTPHATAMKSRRAAVSLQLPLEDEENGVASVSAGSVNDDSVAGDSNTKSNQDVSDANGEDRDFNHEFQSALNEKPTLEGNSSNMIIDSSRRVEERIDEYPLFLNLDEKSDDFSLNVEDLVELDTCSTKRTDGQDTDVWDLNISAPIVEEESVLEKGNPSLPSVSSTEEHGDDESSFDVSELLKERMELLQSERICTNDHQKRKYDIKPLDLAEEQEKKRAFTGLNWVEGATALPMRLEGVRRGSTTLGYFDIRSNNIITKKISTYDFQRDNGSPQVVSLHLNNIAVGTSKGVVVIFPCRYSPHYPDNMDSSQMKSFSQQWDRSTVAVTSMCFSHLGDFLLIGYSNGHVSMWDIQKESSMKVFASEQNLPVVHSFFLGQDSRQFKAVTGNSKGLFLIHNFSLIPVINRFNIKTLRLIDTQQIGIVLSASPLVFEESGGAFWSSSQGNTSVPSSSISSMVGGVVSGEAGWKLFSDSPSIVEESVAVFASYQFGVEVRLIPSLLVLGRISKPDGVREGSVPYIAWKSDPLAQSGSSEDIRGDSAEKTSWLVIAWDRKVQVAKLVKSELKMYGRWSLESVAMGVAWLDIHMLIVFSTMGQLYLYAKDGTIIHQTSFHVENLGGNDLVTYHTHFLNVFGNPEKAYHNAIAVRGASAYILGPMHLIVARLLPWKERIMVLRSAGDWMGALNMSMTLYDGQAHGVIDLPRSVAAAQDIIMPYLVELILSYVDEVFSYISVAFCNQLGNVVNDDGTSIEDNNVHSEIKEQFTRVGGVAVEFCVHIRRTDILFDDIYAKFLSVHHKETFLELMEPYILRDMLGSLPPEIMQALVEHYNNKGWLQRVEQCILHMDISSLDFNQVVRICRENGLYGALIYLFNKGLEDYRAPLEELLVVSRSEHCENSTVLGYRMLVYLKYCFCGLAFPPGHGEIAKSRLPTIRKELLQFLLEKTEPGNSQKFSRLEDYINLYHFLLLDAEATLDVLRCVLPYYTNINSDGPVFTEMESNHEKEISQEAEILQDVINGIVKLVEVAKFSRKDTFNGEASNFVVEWPSTKDLRHLYEFISLFVACRKASVSQTVLNQIFEFLTSEGHDSVLKKREKQLLAILEAIPESDWDASYVLLLCEKASFHQVCGTIHKKRSQYFDALESFMRDDAEPIHAFVYIHDTLERHYADGTFRSNVFSKIPDLVILSRECAFLLVINQFPNESTNLIPGLQGQSKSLFLYLKTVLEVYFSGTLDFSNVVKKDVDEVFDGLLREQNEGIKLYMEKISEFPKLVQSHPVTVTDDMIELYLELLCQYERSSVLKFLETFDSYRVEYCLRLCQEYEIVDAAAFLLERVGDVGSALSLTLSSLDEKFAALGTALGNLFGQTSSGRSLDVEVYNKVLQMKEIKDIHDVLHACIVLCQRNAPRLVPEESETLWFRLLDSFCGPLMYSTSDKSDTNDTSETGSPSAFAADESITKWKISKSHKKGHILRKLFAQFIKDIVEGMVGFVRLPTIMSKLLSDNGGQEFGDFKTTILGMLGTYGFERRILDTAKALIEDDTFYTMTVLKKGMSHGYAPRALTCCICNCLLAANSDGSSIRLFSCGHSTHLHCEIDGELAARGLLSGCPVCLPKKNSQKSRNKSPTAENSLVDVTYSRSSRFRMPTPVYLLADSSENSGANQISRFDMLVNLEKEQRINQIESIPQLKLAPPAVYHERIKKGPDPIVQQISSNLDKLGRTKKELKQSLRFPLKSSIFGKEKSIKR